MSDHAGGGASARPLAPAPADVERCEAVIRRRSRSFFLASRLLPRAVRTAAVATYAFCRGADDDVDGPSARDAALAGHRATRERLARLYAGEPMASAVDRCFAWVVAHAAIPREEPEALLDGMAQDLETVRVADEEALLVYCYRAAGVVGRMMARIMGRSDAEALRRAVDLGIAMQLTNIARDVGEDARLGRVYLPATWLAEEGTSASDVLRTALPAQHALPPPPALLAVNRRILAAAERYYESGIDGIRLLPPRCRPAILSAALLYREIGRRVLARGGDGVSARVRVSGGRKLVLAASSCVRCALDPRLRGAPAAPHRAELHAPLVRGGVAT